MSLFDQLEGAHQKLLRPSGGCHNCPRHRKDYVPATLRSTPLLWVGEGPGATEVLEQEGFTGKSGQFLRRHSKDVGLLESMYSFTNMIHCRPPNNATPKAKEISCCMSQFVLDEVQDYPIVCLVGSVALQAFFPGALATHHRGNVAYHPDFPGQKFYNIYHPSYIQNRRMDLEPVFTQQLARLSRIVQGEPEPDWRIFQGGSEEMWEMLKAMLTCPLNSLDLETSSLKSWEPHGHIKSLAITADAKNVVFVHEEEPHWIATLELIRKYLENQAKSVAGANIGFDLDWMEHELGFQVHCTGIHDVATIWNQARQYKQPSLKELVSRELDGYRYLIHAPQHCKDLGLLARYNSEDVIYSLQLFHKGIRLLKPKTQDLVVRVLGPTNLCLRQITTHGIYLRQDYRRQKIEEYQDRRKDSITAWREEDPEFIPSTHESGKGLDQYLFHVRGLPVLERTPKGEPQVDQMVIKRWIRDYGASYLQHLLDMREVDKILSTYLTGYDKHLGPDGRVHSKYILTRVPTGRTASQDPNLQNIPRLLEIRDLFGVPPGSVMLEADASQIEFRIMVCLAHDETGIEAYLRGDDAHTTTARQFAKDPNNPTKEERSRAKPINFALVYDGNAYNVQSVAFNDYGLTWSDEQCQRFVDGFLTTYKRLPEFHQASRDKLIRNRGWFESVVGHTAYYREWDHKDTKRRDHVFRSALNSEAQGPAAQMCFAHMVYTRRLLNERGLSAWFVNTIHDSGLLECPNPKQVPLIIETMEEARALVYEWVKPWFVVPFIIDYNVGESWGSLEEYKP